MKCLISDSNNALENLHLERYILENLDGNYIFFYVNNDSIIVGKNQVFQREINNKFVYQKQVPIYRRLSGGGTVFHDLGNLNISLITKKQLLKSSVNYFKMKLCSLLRKKFNIKMVLLDSDMCINLYKVSGSAEYHQRFRAIHHFTLLINSDLKKNENSLSNNNYDCYHTKAKESNPKKIANLQDFISYGITTEEIIELILNSFSLLKEDAGLFCNSLIKKELNNFSKTNNLFQQPKYEFHNNLLFGKNESYPVQFIVEKGKIYYNDNMINDSLGFDLRGIPHTYEDLYKKCKNSDLVEQLI